MKLKKKKNNIFNKLNMNEQITLHLKKSNFDFAKKDWGYYISPSLQKRCLKSGFKGVIVSSGKNYYIAFVHKEKTKLFLKYLELKKYKFISWIYTSKHFSKFFN